MESLHQRTWTADPEGFARDVRVVLDGNKRRMAEGKSSVRLLVLHEARGLDSDSPADERGSCRFQDVLEQTVCLAPIVPSSSLRRLLLAHVHSVLPGASLAQPKDLLKDGIYHMIAIALKHGEWRRVSNVMIALEIGAGTSSNGPSFATRLRRLLSSVMKVQLPAPNSVQTDTDVVLQPVAGTKAAHGTRSRVSPANKAGLPDAGTGLMQHDEGIEMSTNVMYGV